MLICKIDFSSIPYKHIHTDHIEINNTTIIRGILCQNCNMGLGKFKDNLFSLQEAINYIQNSMKKKIPFD